MNNLTIRPAVEADHASIRAVELAAFDGDAEADLVEALRQNGSIILELVAIQEDAIVGHILFSRLDVELPDGGSAAVALAPLAISPSHQRAGIGASLITDAHLRLQAAGERLSVVVGDPAYYGRFGYTHGRAAEFDSDYQCDALQALAWAEAPSRGRLVYAQPFSAL